MLPMDWAGHRFELLHHKAVHWEARRALILADPHFGKAEAFRGAGVPVPAGTTAKTLSRLTEAVRKTKPHRVIVLGDFFHSRAGVTGAVLQRLSDWRRSHAYLEVINVRGNHDRQAGDPPPELEVDCVGEWEIAGVRMVHDPVEAAEVCGDAGGRPTMAGHVHPAVYLENRSDRIRLPCFHVRGNCLILPAFGAFTGAKVLTPKAGDRVYAVGPDGVLAVPVPGGVAV